MYIKKGTSRIVFLMPFLGVAIKLPYVRLLRGIMDNWSEYCFWRRTRHRFLQPTYCSLWGLVNLQRLGKPCTSKEVDHTYQLYEITGEAIHDDVHHFGNPGNFCFDRGEIRILDYSSPKVQEVIEEFGLLIIEKYDPAYEWKGRRRQKEAGEASQSQ